MKIENIKISGMPLKWCQGKTLTVLNAYIRKGALKSITSASTLRKQKKKSKLSPK